MYQNFWVKHDPMYHMWKCHHRIFNVIKSDVFSDIQILLFKDYVILNVLTCSRNVWPLLEAKFACNRTSERQRSQKREQIQLHHFWEGWPTPVVESSRVLHIFAPFHSTLPWPFCFWTAGPGTGTDSTFARRQTVWCETFFGRPCLDVDSLWNHIVLKWLFSGETYTSRLMPLSRAIVQ